MGRVLNGIDWTRDRYAGIVARLVRVSALSVLLIAVLAFGTWELSRRTPTGFLPQEDQGAFFVQAQLPPAASVSRSRESTPTISVRSATRSPPPSGGRTRGRPGCTWSTWTPPSGAAPTPT